MKVSALACAAILGVAFAGPAMAQANRPTDTGSMAFPSPLPQGNVGRTITPRQAPDTGNMAYPAPVPQGNIGSATVPRGNMGSAVARRARRPTDTGSMGYPDPLPQGNLNTTPRR